MTAIEDARAALGAFVPSPRTEPEYSAAWVALRELIAEHERLTTPPSDDEREALADLIEGVGIYIPGSHGHDYIHPGKAADAILVAGFRRQGPITEEWQYGEKSLHSSMVWIVDREMRPDLWRDVPPEQRVRRRKAGPWEPVEQGGVS